MISYWVLISYLYSKQKSSFSQVEFPLFFLFFFFFLKALPFGGENKRSVSFVFSVKQTRMITSSIKIISVRNVYWQSCSGSVFPLFFSNFCPASLEDWHFFSSIAHRRKFLISPTPDAFCFMERFLKIIAIFRSSVDFRARCLFPFSPCSLNMPWPGFPHVVRMVHQSLWFALIIRYLLLHFLAYCLPLSFLPSKQSLISIAWFHCMVFLWALFYLLLFLVLSHVCCI